MLVASGVILLLILTSGFLMLADAALGAARTGRLEDLAAEGDSRAATLLRLREDPYPPSAAMQAISTLVGMLVGVLAGSGIIAPLARHLTTMVNSLPWLAPIAAGLVLVLGILGLTYLALVAGQLVPRRLGQQHAETIAIFLALPIERLTRSTRPLTRLLDRSAHLILAPLGQPAPAEENTATEEAIRDLVREGAQEGAVEPQTKQVIEGVFRLGEQTVRQIMTPRVDVFAIERHTRIGDMLDTLIEMGYSRFPVYNTTLDDIVGVVHVFDVLRLYRTQNEDALIDAALYPALVVPEHARAATLLAIFRKSQRHMAIVVSELGLVEGVVTLEDVLEQIVGDILDEHDERDPQAITLREDGSWLIDGSLPIDQLKTQLAVSELPDEELYHYGTLAGFVLSLFGRIPQAGDHVHWDGWCFEVVDMDGLRIDKVLLRRVEETEPAA